MVVFGGAQPKPGDPAYAEAYELGRLLAQAGHTVMNGGYIGTMEAVSRGAAEAGGQVIGVTCGEIESWRQVAPNPWLTVVWRCGTLLDRLEQLTDGCDAAIALGGGIGTLLEISLMWNRLAIASLPPKPVILVGAGWQHVFDCLYQEQGGAILEKDRAWLKFAGDILAACAFLDAK